MTEPVRPLEALKIAEAIVRGHEHFCAKLRDAIVAALLQAAAPPAPTAEPEQQPICVACSGCGWCEGSPAFTCPVCKGTGHVH
jgi:hypothetical protein